MQYYVAINGRQEGPFAKEVLLSRGVTPTTSVWCEGMPGWTPAGQVPELAVLFQQAPQPQHNAPYPPHPQTYKPAQPKRPTGPKNRFTCGIFAMLLGSIGLQYFYLEKTTAGILSIVLTLVTCGAWEIVTLIQGILMLWRSEEDFQTRYVNEKTFPLF